MLNINRNCIFAFRSKDWFPLKSSRCSFVFFIFLFPWFINSALAAGVVEKVEYFRHYVGPTENVGRERITAIVTEDGKKIASQTFTTMKEAKAWAKSQIKPSALSRVFNTIFKSIAPKSSGGGGGRSAGSGGGFPCPPKTPSCFGKGFVN